MRNVAPFGLSLGSNERKFLSLCSIGSANRLPLVLPCGEHFLFFFLFLCSRLQAEPHRTTRVCGPTPGRSSGRAPGLRAPYCLFGDAVVTPSMTVFKEPHATDPKSILDEILVPHGLLAEAGPGGTIVIVVDPDFGRTSGGKGEIRGFVTVGGNPVAVSNLVIAVEGTTMKATPGVDGSFRFPDVPAGSYTVTVHSPSFLPQKFDDVVVAQGRAARVRFELVPVSVFLNEIVVTPSHFRLLDEQPESRQFLTATRSGKMPHVADDLYRAVKRPARGRRRRLLGQVQRSRRRTGRGAGHSRRRRALRAVPPEGLPERVLDHRCRGGRWSRLPYRRLSGRVWRPNERRHGHFDRDPNRARATPQSSSAP